jgi:hypothetical protein
LPLNPDSSPPQAGHYGAGKNLKLSLIDLINSIDSKWKSKSLHLRELVDNISIMTTVTLPIKIYQTLLKRQEKVEEELGAIRKIIRSEWDGLIRPQALKRWERISRDLDKGSGRSFTSLAEMKKWLRKL